MAVTNKGGVPARPTCVIVDDHEAVRSSLSSLLEDEGFAVVGEAATAAEALAVLEALQPTVAVLDYSLPDATGIDVALGAAGLCPATKLVLHTGAAPPTVVRDALAAGIRAVVLKAVPPTHLLRALDSVLEGELYVDPTVGD